MRQNQTVSYLTRRFREIGLQPATRHGQNFLIDINLQRLIIDTADLGPDDVVLEVGTGTGALTAMMAEQAGTVVTVEIDQHLFELASDELADFSNVIMLRGDALRNKNNFSQEVIDVVREQIDAEPGRQFKLVSNLPFNIATPVLSNLLSSPIVPTSMTATIQKELGDRMVATPSTKDYSALSIWMQSQCDVEIVRVMPPTVFWPQPKVTSAIVKITVDHQRRDAIPELPYWHDFVRAMFLHRRKFIRTSVLGAFKHRLSKPEVDELMASVDFGPTTRAEELDVATMLGFYEVVRAKVPEGCPSSARTPKKQRPALPPAGDDSNPSANLL